MFCIITDNENKLHIVEFKTKKVYYTFCNNVVYKTDMYNVFAANDFFNGLCKKCHSIYFNGVKKSIFTRDSSVNMLYFKLNNEYMKYNHLKKKKFLNSNSESIEKIKHLFRIKKNE